ncbi:17263_t:CDS:2, partial [Dentiscutata erythropus]
MAIIDHALVVIDVHRAAHNSTYNESCLFDRLNDYELPVTLTDLLDNNNQLLQNVYHSFKERCYYLKNTVNISVLKKTRIRCVKEELFSYTYPQEWVYPVETKSEMADLKKVEDFRIVIGKQRSVIKAVTRRACKAMVIAFKRPVRLYLTVK